MTRAEIVAAIQRAGRELGRAPSRGELKRITGVSHYRVLAEFRTLREAVRAAGLEPNPKGQRIDTKALIGDWQRVRTKLGRRPSRSEYRREGRYSPGALVARFGAWGNIGNLTTKDTKEHKGTLPELPRLPKSPKLKGQSHEGNGAAQPDVSGRDKAIAFQWATSLTAIPGPLEGKRRVTEAIAAMVVRTLLGDSWPRAFGMESTQHSAFSIQSQQNRDINHRGHEGAQRQSRAAWSQRGLRKDRPVMGPPFDRRPLTNAPVNEMGVVFLFALVAADLGFQGEGFPMATPNGRWRRESGRTAGLNLNTRARTFCCMGTIRRGAT